MQIECATSSATAEVLQVLIKHDLRPRQEFHIDGPSLPDPPTHFIIQAELPFYLVSQLRSIPDTIMSGT